ncbi:unnamed protein product [Phytophthora fragariaefolia]|uniref:Unnamed protein product n=1 Tax=Phytophthora fragariaefolia TaxID=1490495 RepID=A0A9W7CXC1_9STRA|nr:unnamed protein product [Phytophthora fragariaefolia]
MENQSTAEATTVNLRMGTSTAATGEDKCKALRSVKNSFNRNLLEALCKFEWNTTVEAITDEQIVAELDKIVGNVMNDAVMDVDLILGNKLKMDLRERDVKARVINYFMLCDEIVMQYGLANIFATTTGMKEKCRLLKQHVEPAALRDMVDAHHRLVDNTSKSDDHALYLLVKEKALKQEKHVHRPKEKEQRVSKGSTRTVLVPKSNPAVTAAKTKPRTGCFHCGRDHWQRECTELDEAGKEILLAERKAKRGTVDGSKRFRAKRFDTPASNARDEQATVLINGDLELPYCADSGCDWNGISRMHVKQLLQQDDSVELVNLNEVVQARAVGGVELASTQAVDVRLTLNTAAGPVRCQHLNRCIIVESDEDEVLVDKSLLAELGTDVDRQLEPTVGEIVTNVADALVCDAVDRGVIDKYTTDRLYGIYGGRRLELGVDPPARVPPLKIRLKPNATPYRCKVRQYIPEKSAFLAEFNQKLVSLGWVYENRASRWCCPALPVIKPGTDEFRQTNDYRPLNTVTEPIAGVMPSSEVTLERCKDKMFYAVFDFLKVFLQLPLDESCQEFMSYMTNKGIFTPTRVPQGSTDAALDFQSTIEMVLGDLVDTSVIFGLTTG